MRSIPYFSIAAMSSLTTLAACSQPAKSEPTLAENNRPVVSGERMSGSQTVPGSYIVKAAGDGAETIHRVFASYGVMQVTPLGNEQFEIRLERDPGIEVLNGLAAGSNGAVTAIQPNFVYRAY